MNLCECGHIYTYHNEKGCGGTVEFKGVAVRSFKPCGCTHYRPSPAPPTQEPPAGELEAARVEAWGQSTTAYDAEYNPRLAKVKDKIKHAYFEGYEDARNDAGFAAAPSKAEIIEAFIAEMGAEMTKNQYDYPYDYEKAMRAVADRISKGGKI
jgi:hypothetical protein